MRYSRFNALFLWFIAGAASAASPLADWVIRPEAGYDATRVEFADGTAAGYASIATISSNYYAGRAQGVRFATSVNFKGASGAIVRCSLDAPLAEAMNALITDTFTMATILTCGKRQVQAELRVEFQYQVARTLFLDVDIRPQRPDSLIPHTISYKATLKHRGDNAPNAPTMTVLDLNGAANGEFPVIGQKAYAPIEIDQESGVRLPQD